MANLIYSWKIKTTKAVQQCSSAAVQQYNNQSVSPLYKDHHEKEQLFIRYNMVHCNTALYRTVTQELCRTVSLGEQHVFHNSFVGPKNVILGTEFFPNGPVCLCLTLPENTSLHRSDDTQVILLLSYVT